MNHLLGYGRPSWRPRASAPATYRSGTPRNQHPAVARWPDHLRGLATAIHEIYGLGCELGGEPCNIRAKIEKDEGYCLRGPVPRLKIWLRGEISKVGIIV